MLNSIYITNGLVTIPASEIRTLGSYSCSAYHHALRTSFTASAGAVELLSGHLSRDYHLLCFHPLILPKFCGSPLCIYAIQVIPPVFSTFQFPSPISARMPWASRLGLSHLHPIRHLSWHWEAILRSAFHTLSLPRNRPHSGSYTQAHIK